jgi:hypothetical protein
LPEKFAGTGTPLVLNAGMLKSSNTGMILSLGTGVFLNTFIGIFDINFFKELKPSVTVVVVFFGTGSFSY